MYLICTPGCYASRLDNEDRMVINYAQSSDARKTAGDAVPDPRWCARGCRPQADAPRTRSAPSRPASRARGALPGPHHQAGSPRRSPAAPVRAVQGAPGGVCSRLSEGRVPDLPVLDPGQPHPPDLRGQRRHAAGARDPGLVSARRARAQRPPRADWLGLRRPLSPRDPHHADPDPPCLVLRAPERAAPRRADRSPLRWHGPVLVGVVVRRLERRVLEDGNPATGVAHGGGGGNLAFEDGMEALQVRSTLDHRSSAGGPAMTRGLAGSAVRQADRWTAMS